MRDAILIHSIYGLRAGVLAVADELAARDTTVQTPDFFGGRVTDDREEAFAMRDAADQEALIREIAASAQALPEPPLLGGFSWGAGIALGAAAHGAPCRALLLVHDAGWVDWLRELPEDLPVLIQLADRDPFFDLPADLDAVRALGRASIRIETYPTDRHLFGDPGHPDFVEPLAAQAVEDRASWFDSIGLARP